jgi:hypothetical protein
VVQAVALTASDRRNGLMIVRPETQREKQIVRALGAGGWMLKATGNPHCLMGAFGALVEKSGHQRWVKATQLVIQ